MANKGTKLVLQGQPVVVYHNGVIWIDPDTKRRYLIGSTRAEAETTLKQWRLERFGAFASCAVAPLPKTSTGQQIPRLYWKALYYARSRVSRAKKPLNVLSKEEFAVLVERSAGRCQVTGIEFSAERPPGSRKAMWSPSLDRIDCTKGYELENCRLVCVAVNIALNEFGVEVLARIGAAMACMPLLPLPQTEPADCVLRG